MSKKKAPAQPKPAAPRLRRPYQKDLSVTVAAGQPLASTNFIVPLDKRLIIEFVCCSAGVGVGELAHMAVVTTVDGQTLRHPISTICQRRDSPDGYPPVHSVDVSVSQVVRLYADPGTSVTVLFSRSENYAVTDTYFAASLSGYLVDCAGLAGCPLP